MFGIDVGGTYIKMGEPLSDIMEFHPLPYDKRWILERIEGHTSPFLVTGAGAKTVRNWFEEYDFEIVPELEATGLGAAYLAGESRCIVMNIGSGTPILSVNLDAKSVEHLGGTGLGAASLAGLAYYMTGIYDLDRIAEKGFEGDPDLVNLLIKDIYKDPELLGLPGDATASNFGKYQDWRHVETRVLPEPPDLLAGLHKMVAEIIAVMADLSCGRHEPSRGKGKNLPVVVSGGGTLNRTLMKHLKITFEFLGRPFIIPEEAVYSTLYGLFVYKGLV